MSHQSGLGANESIDIGNLPTRLGPFGCSQSEQLSALDINHGRREPCRIGWKILRLIELLAGAWRDIAS